ncbi:membrane protein insertion efficiency factor YidD [Gilvimarinus polysaccharolyticus]|uniref:membrane protein insertion efficiency factor YidD n=1 Tax=Gilvimarinus polysaccharolyticus TaxID=863921 RepID=UPI0009FC53EC
MAKNRPQARSGRSNTAGYICVSWLAVKLIHIYRYLLSPWVGNQCRFYPTCSHYSEEAINRFGFIKGVYLTFCRLLKCHPWHPGGFDPIPDNNLTKSQTTNGKD